MRTLPLAIAFSMLAGCQSPLAPSGDQSGNLGGKADGQTAADDWHAHIGEYAFEAPHGFQVIRTSYVDIKLMDVLGDQTVVLSRTDENHKEVTIASATTQSGRTRIAIPAGAQMGTIDLSTSPWELAEMGAFTYWPKDGGGLTSIDYASPDGADHAIIDFQGVAILEGGAVDLVLRSDTTGTELHRYHMAPPDYVWRAWQDPNGYVTFNAPIERAGLAQAGEILSVHAVTKSGDATLACAVVEHSAEFSMTSARLLDSCPKAQP